jgi:formylglycine-generating enzyme required for sulfatase activity
MYKYRIITFILSFITCSSYANNLQIGAVTVSTSSGNQYLNFSIGWENSWRVNNGPTNWDAVWVFVKRRDCAALQWRHVNLASQDTAHTAGTPLFVDAYSDKKGVMIYRNSLGSGSISNINIQLKIDSVVTGNYDYQVFGIEMVYVPEGAFYLGDGIAENTFRKGTTQNPYYVNSEDSIYCSQFNNDLYSTYGMGNGGLLPTLFPKGFNPFYCMKYEISQGQYADFLNNISSDAMTNRYDPTKFPQNRYTISGTWPAITASSPNRACNWLNFFDLTAYLDWSALSPMTELEIEKICRGSGNNSIANEFAWGSVSITDADSIVNGTDGQSNESVGNLIDTGSGLANFGNDNILGPLRCGFAAKSATTRFQAGASYYGIMELSGNLYERCYNVFLTLPSINFSGSHGDGELSTTPSPGFANQNWPIEAGPPTSEYYSAGIRCGAWISDGPANELRVSDRSFTIASVFPGDGLGRANSTGGRGVSRRQQ